MNVVVVLFQWVGDGLNHEVFHEVGRRLRFSLEFGFVGVMESPLTLMCSRNAACFNRLHCTPGNTTYTLLYPTVFRDVYLER